MGRPREHSAATQAGLLEVAHRLLAEEGPNALGLRVLAQQVGTTTRAVYSLFGSKRELVRALYVAGFAELVKSLRAVPTTFDDPGSDLLRCCATYRAFARANPTRYQLMCERLIADFEPTLEDRRHALGALIELARRLDACRWAGVIVTMFEDHRRTDPDVFRAPPLPIDPQLDLLTRQWWAMMHGLTALEIRGFLGTEADADQVWEATLQGLLACSGPQTRA